RGEVDAEDLCRSGAAGARGQLADRADRKRTLRASAQRGDDIARDAASLANRVVRRRRMEAAARAVGDERAIAERPHAGPTLDLEGRRHADAAALLHAWQRRDERIRRRPRGPD